jgi:hypothetical protein
VQKNRQRHIDRSIIFRFTIAFGLLTALNILNLTFQVASISAAKNPFHDKTPDYSTSGAVSDVLIFIPGVSCSMIAWAIWGTTKQYFTQTKELFMSIFGCCCCHCVTKRKPSGPSVNIGGNGAERRENRFKKIEGSRNNKNESIHEAEELRSYKSGSGSDEVLVQPPLPRMPTKGLSYVKEVDQSQIGSRRNASLPPRPSGERGGSHRHVVSGC